MGTQRRASSVKKRFRPAHSPTTRQSSAPPESSTAHSAIGRSTRRFIFTAARGEEPRLPAEVFKKLHTPLPGDEEKYAFGWIATDRGWAGGKALTHGGSNTMWFAVIWLAPRRGTAYMAATNAGSNTAFTACDAAIGKLIEAAQNAAISSRCYEGSNPPRRCMHLLDRAFTLMHKHQEELLNLTSGFVNLCDSGQ